MDEITDRHTRAMLRTALPKAVRPIDPARVQERKDLLENMGLLDKLTKSVRTEVVLPDNRPGTATGMTDEGLVIVEGWSEPFNPRAITVAR